SRRFVDILRERFTPPQRIPNERWRCLLLQSIQTRKTLRYRRVAGAGELSAIANNPRPSPGRTPDQKSPKPCSLRFCHLGCSRQSSIHCPIAVHFSGTRNQSRRTTCVV